MKLSTETMLPAQAAAVLGQATAMLISIIILLLIIRDIMVQALFGTMPQEK